MAAALESKLEKLLSKHKVDGKVRAYLLSKNLTTVGQFASLADSKADVGDGICLPAGLEVKDRTLCGAVKMAWLEAEAHVTAELDQIKKGKFTDLDDPIDPEVRIKKTTNFIGRYHIRLPAHLIGCDTLAGRCVREHERKTPTAQNIMKIKSLAYKPDASDKGTAEEEKGPLTRYKFMYKHRVLMNTLALAVAPDWDEADWSILLDYHEWMVLKLFEEKKGQLPPLAAVMEADFQMRTKWIEVMRNDKKTMTEAVKLCRTEWVSLFSDMHEGQVKRKDDGPEANPKRARKDAGPTQEAPSKRARRDLPRIQVDPKTGEDICPFYNQGKCTFGSRCKYAHVCNVRGCGAKHAACDNHTM